MAAASDSHAKPEDLRPTRPARSASGARKGQRAGTLSDAVRARLLAGFLVANLCVVLLHLFALLEVDFLYLFDELGADWPTTSGGKRWRLDMTVEGGPADRYSGIVIGVAAVLAAAQALRPPAPRSGPRWLWIAGWLSAAGFIAWVAIWELF